MKALIWILRIYFYIIVAWVLLSWLGGIPAIATLRNLIGIIVEPVVRPFYFLSFGGLSIAPMVPAFIIWTLIGYLERSVATSGSTYPQFRDEPADDRRDSDGDRG
ncbi:YggT family protein [bacterium]|nr:YggT family protein [bacterium]